MKKNMSNWNTELYVKEKIEVLEYYKIRTEPNIDLIEKLGKPLVDFYYCDQEKIKNLIGESVEIIDRYRKKDDELSHFRLKDISDKLSKIHPYLIILSIEIDTINSGLSSNRDYTFNYPRFEQNCFKIIELTNTLEILFKNFFDIDHSKAPQHIRFYDFIDHLKDNNIYTKLFTPIKLSNVNIEFFPEHDSTELFTNKKPILCHKIKPVNFVELILFVISQMIAHDVRLRACKNCGRYFVLTGQKNAEYCDRLMKNSTKTCKQFASMRKYEQKKKENPVHALFGKAYRTRNARVRYGKISKDEFTMWSKNARKMRDICFEGKITLAEFEDWINSEQGYWDEI